MDTKIKLGENAKVLVKYKITPSDYSNDLEENIRAKFAKKYGIKKENISLCPIYKTLNGTSEDTALVNEASQNIQDPMFQQKLFKQYIEEKEIADYDFDKIIEIDDLINSTINYELYDKHKKYSFKWIKWSNFMSYGENNYFDFTSLKDLVLLTSLPANQGGKTTFCIDLFRFLLFGKVTSREDDWTLSKVFNDHIPSATEVSVEGCICIDNEDYVIKRVITRPSLAKRTKSSKVTQKITYYKIVGDSYVQLEDDSENLQGSTATETNKLIKEAIGNERDFDLMICANSDNLKGLISLKDTERGRLLSRWIGLLPIEEKDKNAREMFNKKISPSLKMNTYNKVELSNDIEVLENENKENEETLKQNKKYLKEAEKQLKEYKDNKDALLSSKKNIDGSLSNVDINTVNKTIETLTEQGINKKIENIDKTGCFR